MEDLQTNLKNLLKYIESKSWPPSTEAEREGLDIYTKYVEDIKRSNISEKIGALEKGVDETHALFLARLTKVKIENIAMLKDIIACNTDVNCTYDPDKIDL